jgi:hypothetical protein
MLFHGEGGRVCCCRVKARESVETVPPTSIERHKACCVLPAHEASLIVPRVKSLPWGKGRRALGTSLGESVVGLLCGPICTVHPHIPRPGFRLPGMLTRNMVRSPLVCLCQCCSKHVVQQDTVESGLRRVKLDCPWTGVWKTK